MKVFAGCILFNFIFFAPLLPRCVYGIEERTEKTAAINDFAITMFLAKRSAIGQHQYWPSDAINVTSELVPVRGKTIQELLKDNHVFPDVEAFNLVYVLNPDLYELSQINVRQLKIPKVTGGPQLEADFAADYVILIIMDKALKDQFRDTVESFNRQVHNLSQSGTRPPEFQELPQSTVESLIFVADRLAKINERITQRYGRPIPTEVLRQLVGDANLLALAIEPATSSPHRIPEDASEIIEAVKKDIELKERPFSEAAAGEAPARWPEVNVSVKTLKQGHQISNLRIRYVPEALKSLPGEVQSFSILSSPSSQLLPEADYCFWAVREPIVATITNVQCSAVRTNQQVEVQLTVLR